MPTMMVSRRALMQGNWRCARRNLRRRPAISTRLLCQSHSTDTAPPPPQVRLEHVTRPHHDADNGNDSPPTISILTLDRPKANAMGRHMVQELEDCVVALQTEDSATRCLVVTSSSPKVFSAGADLKERAQMTSLDEVDAFVTRLRNAMQAVAALPMPVLAAVEGVALGGGLELALAADWRVVSHAATLGLPETSLAIVSGAGGTQRLMRLIGMSRAKELIWTGRRLNGQKAFEWGLVDRVVEPGTCLDVATELAWEIAVNGPLAVRAAKEAMDRGIFATTMDEALEIERECYAKILPTQDRLEGLQAFREDRLPQYKGQ